MKKLNENWILWGALLIAMMPAMILRDYTPSNELRYLSIADEALRDGHIFTFYNQGTPYADKPPLYLWIVMACKLLFGKHCMYALSLFSMIPALVIMTVMDKWTTAYANISAPTRLAGKLMLMTTGLFVGLALTLRMDMLMCMFITLALYTFYKMYNGDDGKYDNWIFPIYVFLAIFSKGPVGILVPLLATAVFLFAEGQIKSFGRYWGWHCWGILLSLCLVWFGCVYAEGGTPYLDNLLFNQTVNRAVDSFTHKEPFYYYFISFWYSLAPWSIFIFGCLVIALKKYKHLEMLERFHITVIVTTLLMLSLISSKIAVYLTPAFPFFVYIAVIYLDKARWSRWSAVALAIPSAAFVTTIALCFIDISKFAPMMPKSCSFVSLITFTGGLVALYMLYGKHDLRKGINALAMSILATIFVGGMYIPSANEMIGYEKLSTEAMSMAHEADTNKYASFGIPRPESIDVFLGEDIVKVDDEQSILKGDYNGYILIIRKKRITDNLKDFVSHHNKVTALNDYIIVAL